VTDFATEHEARSNGLEGEETGFELDLSHKVLARCQDIERVHLKEKD
jgi:hypothetical protein